MELEKGQYSFQCTVPSIQPIPYLFLNNFSRFFFFFLSLSVTETHWIHVQFIC